MKTSTNLSGRRGEGQVSEGSRYIRECCEKTLKPINAEVMTHVHLCIQQLKHVVGTLSVNDPCLLGSQRSESFL